jgi:hypothetical protein
MALMCSTNIKSVFFTVKMKHPDKVVAWHESIVNAGGYKISLEHQPSFHDRKCNSCSCVVEWLTSMLQYSGNDILLSDDQIGY